MSCNLLIIIVALETACLQSQAGGSLTGCRVPKDRAITLVHFYKREEHPKDSDALKLRSIHINNAPL